MEVESEIQRKYNEANALEEKNLEGAIKIYEQLIAVQDQSEETNRIKEQAIYRCGKIYGKLGKASQLGALIKEIRPFFDSISKAKTAKIVRTLIDLLSEIPNTQSFQIDLCKESIIWAKETKRNFLRQRIETKLGALYLESRQFQLALEIITQLVKEVKKLDDKLLLVEIQLIESKIHHALKNLPKSKASLTAARTNANAIYCPPSLQTQLDMQSGTLHAEEKEYKIAYSYFFEAFEGLSSLNNDSYAIKALKYMLLSKIMLNLSEDVESIISGKLALRYAGRDIEAMRAVATAHRNRSLHLFEQAKINYKEELTNDPIIHSHLTELYETLLQQNLCRIIEPFSVVEISHVAKLINLPMDLVERKLSQMILDKKFHGILDQGAGHLIVFDDPKIDETYESALGTIENMGTVVDSLFEKAAKLT